MYRQRSRSRADNSPPPRSRSRANNSPPPRSRSRANNSPPRQSPSRSPASSSPPPRSRPPSPSGQSRKRRAGNRRSYAASRSPRRRPKEVKLLLCVFHSTSHKWKTEPLRFNPSRVNDRQLWGDIRYIFRTDLQKPWRRYLGFKKVTGIVPIYYTPNGVPVRTDPKDYPASQSFMHAYHHPEDLRPEREWVDFLTNFDAKYKQTNGLEFVEGLYAEKLLVMAILATVTIIVISVVWCALGGDLQTVFTVMGFVLTLAAAQIALAALYYQIALPG